jgi:diguanylate cyclase (GGDEF)-like protein/PAS domain S-box-containing protein
MTDQGPWIAECEQEPVHAPGAIQSWGALLVADAADLIVRHASANLGEHFGIAAQAALGRPLGALLDPETLREFLASRHEISPPGLLRSALPPASHGVTHPIVARQFGGALLVEIKPTDELDQPPREWTDARRLVDGLRSAPSTTELLGYAASEIRRVTGFDRALVYRFDPTGHGEIVAEDRAPDLEPLLGLHYPASDIPRQTRLLYLRQRVRVIADVASPPVPLLSAPGVTASPDLSISVLRAASPLHLDYLRKMGVRATVAVSLTVQGVLWGMLVCHHRTPRLATSAHRTLADLIGQFTALMIPTLAEAEARATETARATQVAAIVARLATRHDGAAGLARALPDLADQMLAVCDAPAAIARIGGSTVSLGDAPVGDQAARLLDRLLAAATHERDVFAHDAIRHMLPADAASDGWAGALILPALHGLTDAIAWLRPEQATTVRWAGDPRRSAMSATPDGKLAARQSFTLWLEQVRGRSRPWQPHDLAAARALRREIDQHIARSSEIELERLRNHDPVTGLANRSVLKARLEHGSGRRVSSCLLIVDLDRFKAVQDALGEASGDALLRQASDRLTRIASPVGAMVARIGGSEFAVFGDRIAHEAAAAMAETIRLELGEAFQIGDKTIAITASVGIAAVSADAPGLAPGDLLSHADLALQAAKQGGGNRTLVFHDKLRVGADRRMEVEQELRAALKGDTERAGSFHLLYQPCVSLAGQRPAGADQSHGRAAPPLRGFEALLRWQHPRLGSVPPAEFVAIAEECGLIGQLGDWVMQHAIDQLADWARLADGLPVETWRVAVNVSPRQLGRPGFVDEVLRRLFDRDVQPRCLTVEVTEGVFADEDARAVIAGLRRAGIKISVDDFGVGYSSLSYIRRLPADELKLDRSFLQSAEGAPRHEQFLGALVQMARAAGLSVLAEGVETEEHLAAVCAAGCDAAQGWLFSRALPPDDAAAWIAAAMPQTRPQDSRAPLPFSFRDIVEASTNAVLVMTATAARRAPSIVYVNPAFCRMSGYSVGEVLGRSPSLLFGPDTDLLKIAGVRRALLAGESAPVRLIAYTRAGVAFRVEGQVTPLRDQDGNISHFVASHRDVTHERRHYGDVEALVERDALTSIANRQGLARFAEHAAGRLGESICLIYIDIDRFAQFNAQMGRKVGDALLLGVADLLAENMRRVDFIGRLGNDDFLIGMPSIRPADALAVAKRLRRMLTTTLFPTPAGPMRIDCSLCVTAQRPGETGLDAAIARAQAALTEAKKTGGRAMLDELSAKRPTAKAQPATSDTP